MRLNMPAAIAAFAMLALAAPAQAQTAPAAPARGAAPVQNWQRFAAASEVQIRDVAAFVRITPENRTDVAISIQNRGPLRAPDVRVSGERLIVDGRMRRQIRSCRVEGDNLQVTTSRNGRLSGEQLPVIYVRVPQHAVVSASGAVRMRVAPSQAAKIAISGCGDADIERVSDEAEISIAGAPDVRLYEAGSATVSVAGSGDVVAGAIHDGLTVSIAGAGDVVVARADGPTNIAIQGAGDVTVREGRATTLSVMIAGAGDVVHNGSAARLDAAILGAGDVRVRHVEGEVTRRVLGGGDVIVGR